MASVSIMPTKLSADPAAPARMSPNLIEHMQLRTARQRGVVAQRQQVPAGGRAGGGQAAGGRRAGGGRARWPDLGMYSAICSCSVS